MPESRKSIFPLEDRSKEEQDYFEFIDVCCSKKINRRVSNGAPSHAIYLLYKFLSSARKSVKICTGHLSQKLDDKWLAYAEPQLARAATNFLMNERAKLSIIILQEPSLDAAKGEASIEDHPFIKSIPEETPGALSVKEGDLSQVKGLDYHFMVMDDEAFRLEYDTTNALAFVNFGDKQMARKVGEFFDEFDKRCTSLVERPAI